jgi:glycosyltransferase involved in cell wall biosynthesis
VAPPSLKKGTDVLLAALHLLPSSSGHVIWVTSAADVLREDPRVAEQIKRGVLVLRSPVDDSTLSRLYGTANAAVVPSRWEGFSFPIAEALSVGTGVIASDIPAHEEFDVDGLLRYGPEDAEGLADLMCAALEQPMRCRPSRQISPVAFAQAHIAVYERVLA